jgi:hypothetical protein
VTHCLWFPTCTTPLNQQIGLKTCCLAFLNYHYQ